MADDAACGGSFANGWIVFVDTDGDIVHDVGESVIRKFPAAPDGIAITTNDDANYFSYAPTGVGRGDVGGAASVQTALLCDDRGNVIAAGGSSAARLLVLTPVGRSNVVRDVGQIDATTGGCP